MFAANIRIDENWLTQASRRQENLKMTRKVLTAIKALCLLMLLGIDALLVSERFYFPASITVGLTLLLIFSRSFDRYVFARRSRKSPFWEQDVKVELDDDAFRESCSLASSTVQWPAFTRCVSLSDGFLLYHGPNIWRWLPLMSFEDRPTRESIDEFLAAKVKRFERA
jgi:hypothetical protein